jgi:hypothetical protein
LKGLCQICNVGVTFAWTLSGILFVQFIIDVRLGFFNIQLTSMAIQLLFQVDMELRGQVMYVDRAVVNIDMLWYS